ncbi:MAG: NUDIX hydrolase [bacterium]
MKVHKKSFNIQKPFGNLFRKKHVLVVIIDKNNNLVLGMKPNVYPDGISRFIGGGIHKNENTLIAAKRELFEETRIYTDKSNFKELMTVIIDVKDQTQKLYHLVTYIYVFKLQDNIITPSDDIKNIEILNLEELYMLSKRYFSLPNDQWKYKDENKLYSWGDYGKVYGYIHKLVADELKLKKLI